MTVVRKIVAGAVLAGLGCAVLPPPALAADIDSQFCPLRYPREYHFWNEPVRSTPQWLEVGWYSPPKNPVVEETVPLNATVSRPDGSRAHEFPFTAWTRSNPGEGYEIYGRDSMNYGPADTGRWVIHGAPNCADASYWAFGASRFTAPVPTTYVVAGSKVSVGVTARGTNNSGTEAPVAGMLVDIDRSPFAPGYPRTHAARPRTDSAGRARSTQTIYSNTKVYFDNVIESSSRHDPAPLVAQILVRKRITETVSDSTPAVGQAVKMTGTVYPARGTAYLQRWNGSTFVTLKPGILTGGRYAFWYTPATRGRHVLRVLIPYDLWHVSSASPNAYLTVH